MTDLSIFDDVTVADGEVVLLNAADAVVGTFETIQAAVDAAEDGATILIGAGVYAEQVTASGFEGLTIIAQDNAVLVAPETLVVTSQSFEPGSEFDIAEEPGEEVEVETKAMIDVADSTHVSIHNLTIDGSDAAIDEAEGDFFVGVKFEDTSGGLYDVHVTGIRGAFATDEETGETLTTVTGQPQLNDEFEAAAVIVENDISTGDFSDLRSFQMIGGSISDFQDAGLYVIGADVEIRKVDVTGSGPQPTNQQYGIYVAASTGVVAKNTVKEIGVYIDPENVDSEDSAGASALIFISGPQGLEIKKNKVVGANKESEDAFAFGIIADTSDGDGGLGTFGEPRLQITDNEIKHVEFAVSLVGDSAEPFVVDGNEITKLDTDQQLPAEFGFPTPLAKLFFGRLTDDAPVFGTAQDLAGTSEADVLAGGVGDDVFSGRGGADILAGDAGSDLLKGGRGSDILLGDATGVEALSLDFSSDEDEELTEVEAVLDPTLEATLDTSTARTFSGEVYGVSGEEIELLDTSTVVDPATHAEWTTLSAATIPSSAYDPTGDLGAAKLTAEELEAYGAVEMTSVPTTYATVDDVKSLYAPTSTVTREAGAGDVISTELTESTGALETTTTDAITTATEETTYNDTLLGGRGADAIDGGLGDDSIKGGRGADTLAGGQGNDTITGGKSSDTFIITGDGQDIITDFSTRGKNKDVLGGDGEEFSTDDDFRELIETVASGEAGLDVYKVGKDLVLAEQNDGDGTPASEAAIVTAEEFATLIGDRASITLQDFFAQSKINGEEFQQIIDDAAAADESEAAVVSGDPTDTLL